MLAQLKAENFSKHLNSKFKIFYTDDFIVEAELTEVFEIKTQENLESFSLIFLFPPDSPIEQRTFKVEHSEMGIMELFLVPIGQKDNGIRYESIFNRLLET